MRSAKLPRVGIVIANHNNAAYVAEAIGSAAYQTVRNLEIVIVDDASTDNSDEVIRETLTQMADARLRYIRLDANYGQAGAIRHGIDALGSSEFVCFLDSDDVWHDNFIERHLAAHLNADFPVGFTYCDCHFINAESELLAGTAWWFERPPADAPHRLVISDTVPAFDAAKASANYPPNPAMTLHAEWSPSWSSNSTASMMFRRSVLKLIMPSVDEYARLYLDFYLSTFCVLMFGGIAIHEALYSYRMHGKNKHSNAEVLGGTFQTSSKDWGTISQDIMEKILTVMLEREAALTRAIGADHYARGVLQLNKALAKDRRRIFSFSWDSLAKAIARTLRPGVRQY